METRSRPSAVHLVALQDPEPCPSPRPRPLVRNLALGALSQRPGYCRSALLLTLEVVPKHLTAWLWSQCPWDSYHVPAPARTPSYPRRRLSPAPSVCRPRPTSLGHELRCGQPLPELALLTLHPSQEASPGSGIQASLRASPTDGDKNTWKDISIYFKWQKYIFSSPSQGVVRDLH